MPHAADCKGSQITALSAHLAHCMCMISHEAPPLSHLHWWRLQAELEDQVWISTSFEDLCDQNVIVYLLRVKAKEYMPQVSGIPLCHAPSGGCQLHPGLCTFRDM
jgi:hypothetical protein